MKHANVLNNIREFLTHSANPRMKILFFSSVRHFYFFHFIHLCVSQMNFPQHLNFLLGQRNWLTFSTGINCTGTVCPQFFGHAGALKTKWNGRALVPPGYTTPGNGCRQFVLLDLCPSYALWHQFTPRRHLCDSSIFLTQI